MLKNIISCVLLFSFVSLDAMAKPPKFKKKSKIKRKIKGVKKMFAIFEIESGGKALGEIKIKLFHEKAPKTVANFTIS